MKTSVLWAPNQSIFEKRGFTSKVRILRAPLTPIQKSKILIHQSEGSKIEDRGSWIVDRVSLLLFCLFPLLTDHFKLQSRSLPIKNQKSSIDNQPFSVHGCF